MKISELSIEHATPYAIANPDSSLAIAKEILKKHWDRGSCLNGIVIGLASTDRPDMVIKISLEAAKPEYKSYTIIEIIRILIKYGCFDLIVEIAKEVNRKGYKQAIIDIAWNLSIHEHYKTLARIAVACKDVFSI